MFKNKKNNEISIVTIDPYEQTGFKFQNNEVDILDISKTAQKQNFFISYLKFKDIITTTINLPRNTSEDELTNIISIKTYEELSLDAAVDYKITYAEMQSQNENRLFNVFVVNNDLINKNFKDISKKIPYIDYLAVAPLLYGAVYKRSLLPSVDVDCFVCLQDDDAFLAVYSGGEYLASRPLRYTLNYIKDKYVEQSGERTSDEAFFKMLATKGLELDRENENFNPDLNTVFEDCLFYINDTINIINRIYFINVNSIYIDCSGEGIANLDKFTHSKLGIKTSILNANITINSKHFNISQQHNMMALFAKLYQDEGYEEEFNFSTMMRPEPFAKRKSGQFILTCLIALGISLAYPIYNYIAGEILEQDSQRLNNKLTELNAQANEIKQKLAQLSKEQDEVKGLTAKEQEKLDFRKSLLDEIQSKKNSYAMKGVNLFELTNIINDNDVQITSVTNDDRNLTIAATSDNEKKITELIKAIAQTPKYSVNTKKIYSDELKRNYESNISIEIKQ